MIDYQFSRKNIMSGLKNKIPASWIKYRIEQAIDCMSVDNSPGHLEILIGMFGLKVVLRFVSIDILKLHKVKYELSEADICLIDIIEDLPQ